MALSGVEIIAVIFAVIGLIKLLVIAVKKEAWHENVVKPAIARPGFMRIVYAVLAVVVLYFLLQELTIVQIFAAMAFAGMLMGLMFTAFHLI